MTTTTRPLHQIRLALVSDFLAIVGCDFGRADVPGPQNLLLAAAHEIVQRREVIGLGLLLRLVCGVVRVRVVVRAHDAG